MFFSKKSKEEVSRINPGFEETEHKTPFAGYILLIAMFMASLFFGWRALDDLQTVPHKPPSLSQCASPFLSYSWEEYGRFQYESYPTPEVFYEPKPFRTPAREQRTDCVFSPLEQKYGVPAIFESRKGSEKELHDFEQELGEISASLFEYERQYGIGLQEKIAREELPIFATPEIKKNIQNALSRKQGLQAKIASLKSTLMPSDDQLKAAYTKVVSDYRVLWRWYELYVFLLEAIFVIPFFLIVFWLYRRQLAKHSPYTVIFTALVGVASVLFLRILLVWFWGLFLARVIEEIWKFIQNFALLKSLVFYGGMLLSIAVFGGAVYLLQKRIFDPRRVAIRRLRQKQCPNCQTSLDLAEGFCPNCGRQIREKCASCGNARFSDMPYCPYCRVVKEQ